VAVGVEVSLSLHVPPSCLGVPFARTPRHVRALPGRYYFIFLKPPLGLNHQEALHRQPSSRQQSTKEKNYRYKDEETKKLLLYLPRHHRLYVSLH
jgi:hypothetical protein